MPPRGSGASFAGAIRNEAGGVVTCGTIHEVASQLVDKDAFKTDIRTVLLLDSNGTRFQVQLVTFLGRGVKPGVKTRLYNAISDDIDAVSKNNALCKGSIIMAPYKVGLEYMFNDGVERDASWLSTTSVAVQMMFVIRHEIEPTAGGEQSAWPIIGACTFDMPSILDPRSDTDLHSCEVEVLCAAACAKVGTGSVLLALTLHAMSVLPNFMHERVRHAPRQCTLTSVANDFYKKNGFVVEDVYTFGGIAVFHDLHEHEKVRQAMERAQARWTSGRDVQPHTFPGADEEVPMYALPSRRRSCPEGGQCVGGKDVRLLEAQLSNKRLRTEPTIPPPL